MPSNGPVDTTSLTAEREAADAHKVRGLSWSLDLSLAPLHITAVCLTIRQAEAAYALHVSSIAGVLILIRFWVCCDGVAEEWLDHNCTNRFGCTLDVLGPSQKWESLP